MIARFQTFLDENRRLWFLLSGIFLGSAIIGCLLPKLLSPEWIQQLQAALNAKLTALCSIETNKVNADTMGWFPICKNYWLLFLAWGCCGFVIFGKLPAMICFIYQGAMLGFTCNLMMNAAISHQMVAILLLLLPANLIFLPLFFLLMGLIWRYTTIMQKNGIHLDGSLVQYLAGIVMIGMIAIIGCWLQAVASPNLLQWFYQLIAG